MLTVRGGKRRGLLVNSSNLCARKYRVIARFKAQNGRMVRSNRVPIKAPACRSVKRQQTRR
jgi:hypothetical protein